MLRGLSSRKSSSRGGLALVEQRNHRMAESGWLWRSSCPTFAQAGTPRAGCPRPCPGGFWRKGTLQPLGSLHLDQFVIQLYVLPPLFHISVPVFPHFHLNYPKIRPKQKPWQTQPVMNQMQLHLASPGQGGLGSNSRLTAQLCSDRCCLRLKEKWWCKAVSFETPFCHHGGRQHALNKFICKVTWKFLTAGEIWRDVPRTAL